MDEPKTRITAEQLRQARRDRAGLSQEKLAELLGHGSRTIQHWEKHGVPRGKEALIRSVLGEHLPEPQELVHQQQLSSIATGLSEYSDAELLLELARRLQERSGSQD